MEDSRQDRAIPRHRPRQPANGKRLCLHPAKQGGKGTVAGIIRISNDGKNWKEVERFEFGNLINDPSKRYHHFKQTVKARYVQVEAAEIAARTEAAALAGIDIF